MRHEAKWDIARLIESMRSIIEGSRRHLAQVKRDMRDAERANDAMRRDLAAWRQWAETPTQNPASPRM